MGQVTAKLVCFLRCLYGHCSLMATLAETVFCKEILKTNEAEPESSTTCITGHPGFDAVCLTVWVLQAAFFP